MSKSPAPQPRAPRQRIQARRSGVHGKGVFALVDLAEGEALIEYTGEIIDWEEALEIAQVQLACGAEVVLGLPRAADVAIAEKRCKALGLSDKLAGEVKAYLEARG